MRPLNYNPSDADSIISYAKKLVGKKLSDFTETLESQLNDDSGNKGYFGQTLEEHYFGYKANSNSEPDFPEAGLELKSAALKIVRRDNWVAKERLVLNVINYHEIVKETFEHSSFYKKNAHLLLVFFKYEKGLPPLQLSILLVGDWKFTGEDLDVIIKDWLLIRDKVINGLAHEISEGDTFYLGACTKGDDKNTLRGQPYSDKPAKQRAFSLKASYVNHIIANLGHGRKQKFGKLLKNRLLSKSKTINDIVEEKLNTYVGLTDIQIRQKLNLNINQRSKHYNHLLTKSMLGFELNEEIEEFSKAGIIVKTVKIEESDRIIQSVSFKSFKYDEIINVSWEDSDLKEIVESKFLFLFFRHRGNSLYFDKVKFWNMSPRDIEQYESVYNTTVELIKRGQIVENIETRYDGSKRFISFFPKMKDNYIAHVRPHAKDRNDTYPLPIPDIKTGLKNYPKHCFWIKAGFVYDKIYNG